MKKAIWDKKFAPSYTPTVMLELGVFEGKYINAIDDLPKSWYKIPKVLKPTDAPDESINRFKVKSRQPLSVWKKNGWINEKHDPCGWFEWYCHYWLGRRLTDGEDERQINRWVSFVARHQGQIDASGDKDDLSKRVVQRQALLQWAWDSTTSFTEEQKNKNLKKLNKYNEVSFEDIHSIDQTKVSKIYYW